MCSRGTRVFLRFSRGLFRYTYNFIFEVHFFSISCSFFTSSPHGLFNTKLFTLSFSYTINASTAANRTNNNNNNNRLGVVVVDANGRQRADVRLPVVDDIERPVCEFSLASLGSEKRVTLLLPASTNTNEQQKDRHGETARLTPLQLLRLPTRLPLPACQSRPLREAGQHQGAASVEAGAKHRHRPRPAHPSRARGARVQDERVRCQRLLLRVRRRRRRASLLLDARLL